MSDFNFLPPHVRTLFGPPPILLGESVADYAGLMKSLWAETGPTQQSQYFAVKELVDWHWQLCRLKAMKTAIANADLIDVIIVEYRRIGIKPTPQLLKSVRHAVAKANSDPNAPGDLEALLLPLGADLQSMMARAYEESLESQLALDRLITTAMRHVRMASDHVDHLRDMVVQRERRFREVERSPEYQKGIEDLVETFCSTQTPVWNGEYVAPENLLAWARAMKAEREQQRETYDMFEASMENQDVIESPSIIASGEDAGISSATEGEGSVVKAA